MAVIFYTLKEDSLSNEKQNGLYKLTNVTVKSYNFTENQLGIYVVPREYEMRMDLISQKLYDSTQYVEELMKLNGILNPFVVKRGDIINYLPLDLMHLMHAKYQENELQPTNLARVDPAKSSRERNRTPSEKPREIKQIVEDEQARKVKIINNFQT